MWQGLQERPGVRRKRGRGVRTRRRRRRQRRFGRGLVVPGLDGDRYRHVLNRDGEGIDSHRRHRRRHRRHRCLPLAPHRSSLTPRANELRCGGRPVGPVPRRRRRRVVIRWHSSCTIEHSEEDQPSIFTLAKMTQFHFWCGRSQRKDHGAHQIQTMNERSDTGGAPVPADGHSFCLFMVCGGHCRWV